MRRTNRRYSAVKAPLHPAGATFRCAFTAECKKIFCTGGHFTAAFSAFAPRLFVVFDFMAFAVNDPTF